MDSEANGVSSSTYAALGALNSYTHPQQNQDLGQMLDNEWRYGHCAGQIGNHEMGSFGGRNKRSADDDDKADNNYSATEKARARKHRRL